MLMLTIQSQFFAQLSNTSRRYAKSDDVLGKRQRLRDAHDDMTDCNTNAKRPRHDFNAKRGGPGDKRGGDGNTAA